MVVALALMLLFTITITVLSHFFLNYVCNAITSNKTHTKNLSCVITQNIAQDKVHVIRHLIKELVLFVQCMIMQPLQDGVMLI